MQLFKAFKLSRGMFRVFIVLAMVIFLFSIMYTWKEVTAAEKRKEHMTGDLRITAITTSYILLSGGKQTVVEHPPTNTTMAYGWATYLCLTEAGHTYFVDDYGTANTRIHSNEFLAITNTESFKTCVAKKIDDAISKIYQTKVIAITLSLISVLVLYIALLIIIPTVIWIAEGFRKN